MRTGKLTTKKKVPREQWEMVIFLGEERHSEVFSYPLGTDTLEWLRVSKKYGGEGCEVTRGGVGSSSEKARGPAGGKGWASSKEEDRIDNRPGAGRELDLPQKKRGSFTKNSLF